MGVTVKKAHESTLSAIFSKKHGGRTFAAFISCLLYTSIVQRRISNTMFLYARQQCLEKIIAEQFQEQEKNNKLMISILSHIVEFRNGESGMKNIPSCPANNVICNYYILIR